MQRASLHSTSLSALARTALALPAATLLALTSPAFALNFSDTGGWRAPLSLDTTSLHRGDPTRVAWGIVPDGTRIGYPGSTYNTLNASLKARCGTNYADMFTFIFNRISAVSGLELVASPDDGALAAEETPPIAGLRGQIRLVGSDLVAWDNWWGGGWANGPGQGVAAIVHLNMGLNTGPNPPSYSDWLDMAMHETGHAIGFGHQQIYENSTTTSEYGSATNHYGSITGFRNGNGPQFDDIYAMHRMYGDRWERNGGNDTLATAEDLGDLTDGTRALGTDIVGLSITPNQIDFRSIDGTSDTDCFKFTITKRSDLRVTLAPVGPTYDFTPEGGTRRTFESSRQSALWMVLYNASGVPLQTVSAAGVGVTRSLLRTLEAGTYTLAIAGTEDLNQFYRLDLASVSNSMPLTISSVADQLCAPNTSTGPLVFSVGDFAVPAASLTVSATSSNPSLVPIYNIVFGGSGANRNVTVTPAPGLTGTATITLSVSDGNLTAYSSFSLTVTPFTYTIASGAVTLTGYAGSGGAVSLPVTINSLPVTAIADYAFASCYSMTSVAIPAGITSIGVAPFADCTILTAMTVDAASANYSSVDGVLFNAAQTALIQYPGAKTGAYMIPASVTSIGDYAFYNCASLTGVTIAESVTSIGVSGFDLCPGLTAVTLPASVTTIADYGFAECSNLASARFMGKAPVMGQDVFIWAASGFTVQYYNNRSGFTTPLWNGYPSTNLGNAVALMVVEQPAGTALTNNSGAVDFGSSLAAVAVPLTFTIRNTGSAPLTGITVSKNGTSAAEYALTTPPPSSLAAGTSSAFVVTFTPTAAGTRTAALHIASNDATNNPFTINLTGSATTVPVPTKLAFTTAPSAGTVAVPFSVTLQAQDDSGSPTNLTCDTTITLSQASGGAALSGNLAGTIASGTNSVTISTPVYAVAGTMTLTATATGGMALAPVTSGAITFAMPAAMIGVDLQGTSGYMLAPSDSAGVAAYAQTHWNTATGASGTLANLVNNTGTSTGATAAWSGDGPYKLWGDQTVTADEKLMEGFIYGWNTATVSVTSLPAEFASYNVLVYCDGQNGTAGNNYAHVQRFVVAAGTATETVYLNDNCKDYTSSNYCYPGYKQVPEASTTGGYTAYGVSNVPGGNYILFTNGGAGFTGDFSITGTAMNDAPGTAFAQTNINAIQVIKAAQSNISYATWALTNAPGQSPSENYNQHGVQNGIAYFMGAAGLATNPSLDASHHITWPVSPTFSGTYEIQSSSDLQTWVPVVPQPSPAGANLTYAVPAGLDRQFIRLVVTPN